MAALKFIVFAFILFNRMLRENRNYTRGVSCHSNMPCSQTYVLVASSSKLKVQNLYFLCVINNFISVLE
jgi:hypothetical protein